MLLYDPDAAARGAVEGVEPVAEPAGLAPCGLVIEAVPESLAVKRALFAELAAAVAPDAVLATNTSSLPVSAIAAGVPGPERVVGLHFFNPPGRCAWSSWSPAPPAPRRRSRAPARSPRRSAST